MPRKFIALALTGLVLPGLGQLYLGHRRKGALLLVLTNLMLLAALFLVLPGLGKLLLASQLDPAAGTQVIADWLASRGTVAQGFLASFMAIWGYGVIDILRSGNPPPAPEP